MIKNFLLLFTIYLVSCIDLKSLKDIIIKIQESPLVNLIFVYDSAKMESSIESYFDQIQQNKQGYFKINIIDCSSLDAEAIQIFTFCTQYKNHLPILTFTSPEINLIDPQTKQKRETEKIAYKGQLDQNKLFQFALPLMKTYSFNLKTIEDLNKFNNQNSQLQRIIYFTDKQINSYYKAVTANFRYSIAFAHVFKNSSLCQILKVDKFPSLLLNGKQRLKIKSNLVKQLQYLKKYQSSQSVNIVIPQPTKISDNFITLQNIQQKIYNNSKYVLLHISDDKPHPQWKNIQDKFQKSFDCYTSKKQIAEQLQIKSIPSIVFFPKSLAKKDISKPNFNEKMTFQQIKHQISDLVQDYSLAISNEDQMQKMIGIPLTQKKVVAILFHNEQVLLPYKILSNIQQYKQNIVFYRFKNPQPEVLENLKIKKIPSILFIAMDNSEGQKDKQKKVEQANQTVNLWISQYTGQFQYNDMKSFLESLISKFKSIQEQHISNARSLVEIKNNNQFQKSCIEGSCYLLLVDNDPQKLEYSKNVLKLGQTLIKRTNQYVVWLDGVCHTQLLQKIEAQQDQLPILLYFNIKLKRYGKLIGRLNEQTLNTFVKKVKNNKIQYKTSYNLEISNKNCLQTHKKLSQLKANTDTRVLSDMEKQIKQQELENKQKTQIQANQVQKNQKKQKKEKKKGEVSVDDL